MEWIREGKLWKLALNMKTATGKGLAETRQEIPGASLVVQWLRLCAPSAGSLGSIPDQRTRTQIRACNKDRTNPVSRNKTWCSQINIKK